MKDGSTTAQFALLLHGRIGRLNRTASDAVRENLGASRQLIALCSSSHLHFVVAANSGPAGGVDIFVHTWNPESAAFIDASYGAHLRASEHQPVEVQNNGRSQSLSIGRAALLMRAHERQRGRAYTLALALRADVTLGSPFLLAAMEPSHIWLPSLCGFWKRIHATARSSHFEEGVVQRTCGARAASTPSVYMARHRIDQLWGLRNANFSSAINLASFTNDFWVAAGPSVLATWIDISEHFASYQFWLCAPLPYPNRVHQAARQALLTACPRSYAQAEDCGFLDAPHKQRKVDDARPDHGRPLSLADSYPPHAEDERQGALLARPGSHRPPRRRLPCATKKQKSARALEAQKLGSQHAELRHAACAPRWLLLQE